MESWLDQLSTAMVSSLKSQLVKCIEAGKAVNPGQFPSQVLCVSEQVQFTSQVEAAIVRNALPSLFKQLQVSCLCGCASDRHSRSCRPTRRLNMETGIQTARFLS